MQYVGQTKRTIKTRLREHLYKIKNKNKSLNFLYQHFYKSGHTVDNLSIQPVEQLTFDANVTETYKFKARCIAELAWIKRLQTPYPLGLNDNIYSIGNISKSDKIDIFSLFHERKRKTRSHGKRRNGNLKRRHRRVINLEQCYSIFLNNGKHRLLSTLSSLSVSTLRSLGQEVSRLLLRTDPKYECCCIIDSYIKHYLYPNVEKSDTHKVFRMKLSFCNKGIDLLNINSILNNKNVQKCVPQYFKNKEVPTICYKYKKPIRNFIFNYNKVVTDDNISKNTPSS